MPLPAETTPHNEALAGDTLTTLVINHKWRRIIYGLLSPLQYDEIWVGNDADVLQSVKNAFALLDDLYTAETIAMEYVSARLFPVADTFSDPVNTDVPIVWQDPSLDTDAHDTHGLRFVSDPHRIVVPVGYAGLYLVSVNAYHTHATANHNSIIRLWHDTGVLASVALSRHQGDRIYGHSLTCLLNLDEGDEVSVTHWSSNVTAVLERFDANGGRGTSLNIVRVGEYINGGL